MVDLVEVNQRGCIEESGQWHDNINRTHLVMASGKPELQKIGGNFLPMEGSLMGWGVAHNIKSTSP